MGLSLKTVNEELEILQDHVAIMRGDIKVQDKMISGMDCMLTQLNSSIGICMNEIADLKDGRKLLDIGREIDAELQAAAMMRVGILADVEDRLNATSYFSLFNSACIVIVGISHVIHVFWGH